MSISEIKGSYDAIFSLGDLCLAGIQLRKLNLRPFAGPLDWMSSPSLVSVNKLLENRFEGFMLKENLLATGYSTGIDSIEKYLVVHDQAYGIVSSHDFKADQNTLENLITYPEVKRKLDRRSERLLHYLETGKKILFVRTEASFADTLKLEEILTDLVKNEFHILIINHTDVDTMKEKNWPITHVSVVEFPKHDKWNNNDDLWKELFSEVEIVSEN
ncbi:DUF1796 family putative cysteine peptidase [Bacillus sp. B1-b2]|uniref:DUF1796 family putative cysteine peptidase n=1 Tax=Bacillus sp. B1-b2 TaxID=2653201 RepID=UPI001261FB42|nr:DUF1796 family putative cysteine peptidase [Bacillus sp. B1-b2]KAB7671189.1 peptidase [Bacillus sp. B1-b2]